MAAFALVLFDIDGCTAIVDSRKLCLDGKLLLSGQQGYTKLGRQRLRVEILQVSDSKQALNEFEAEWIHSDRSKALVEEKKKRHDKPHGYLSVCPQSMNPDSCKDNSKTGGKRKAQEKMDDKSKRGRKGSKGNKIHIVYEGSRDTTSDVAEPKIQPCNFDELTPDEQNLVKLQIEQKKRGKVNVGTQTDPVIVIGPEDLLPAIHPTGSPAVMAILAQIQDTQMEMLEKVKTLCENVQELDETADEILNNLC